MSKFKLVIDFTPYPAAELVPLAQNIQQALNLHASSYPDIPVSAAALATLIDSLRAALVARENGGKAQTLAAELARHGVEDALHADGEYFNGKLDGGEAAMQATAYPYYSVVRTARPNPPAAQTDLVLRHGVASGVVRARYKPDRPHSFNEVQACTGDPNVDANWHTTGFFQNGKADVGGLTPGAVTWLRVRTAGTGGAMGPWSDPAQLRVL